jgi:hypothetical protein
MHWLRHPSAAVLPWLPALAVVLYLVARHPAIIVAGAAAQLVVAVLYWADGRRRGLEDFGVLGFALLGALALPIYWWRHLRGHSDAASRARVTRR